LGSALCSEENDLQLPDLGILVDAFYIGGTKNGALLGEALVICRDSLKDDFRFHMKQKGAYFDLAKHANAMAKLLKNEISNGGYQFLTHSSTNQIFPILPNKLIEQLQEKYSFYVWTKVNTDNSAILLVTSWSTNEEAILAFIQDLKNYINNMHGKGILSLKHSAVLAGLDIMGKSTIFMNE
jgi:threonine aldolase